MAKIIFRLTIEGKTPSTWGLPQTNVMGVKPGKGKKFIDYYPGEDSCFVEDIFAKNKDLKPAKVPLFKYVPQTKSTELHVDETNVSLVNYLKTHPWFGIKFSIFSKEKQAKSDLAEFENVEKALELIKESDENKLKAIAMTVFGLNSFYKSNVQCAAELKAKAIKDPKVIIEALEATNYETKYVAGLAFVSEIIKLNPTHTAIVWSQDDGVILHVAQGENGLDKLTSFLTNETKEAQVLLQEFNTRLERKERMIAKAEDSVKLLSEKDSEIEALKKELEEAKQQKIKDEEDWKANLPNMDRDEEDESGPEPSVLEQLQADYVKKFEKEVPFRYKNDENWLAKELSK
jgi:hypothetical protein